MATPAPEDDAAVRRIEAIDGAVRRAEHEMEAIRRKLRDLAQRRAMVEQERDAFRQQGYDNPYGRFDNGNALGNVLGGILGGVIGGAVLRDTLNGGYHRQPSPWDSDFGGGGFPFPDDAGGGWIGGGSSDGGWSDGGGSGATASRRAGRSRRRSQGTWPGFRKALQSRSGAPAGRTARRGMVVAPLALMGQILTAHACPCPDPNPSLDDLIESGPEIAVFSGRVASILTPDPNGPTVTRIVVQEVIKGDVPPVLEMRGVTLRDDRCGVDLRVGEVRTLGATKQPDGRWITNVCLAPRL